jgi:hypothetical protein
VAGGLVILAGTALASGVIAWPTRSVRESP